MLSFAAISLRRSWKQTIPIAVGASDRTISNLPGHGTFPSSSSVARNSIGSCRNQSNNKRRKDVRRECDDDDTTDSSPKIHTLYRRAVHVIHRHGDRTPITPLQNEDYWEKQLISEETLKKIASYTELVVPTDPTNVHTANGRGPFGKLTELGLQQMIDVGTRLRQELSGNNRATIDEQGRTFYPHIFTPEYDPLEPSNIRVRSTNFLRTIQSVQGLLMGLLQPTTLEKKTMIDIRHTDWMIPDPKPRRYPEQSQLEQELSRQPHITEREAELLPLAISATKALHPMLAPDAREADFGVPQDRSSSNVEIEPLSWNQLAEITKCLSVRELLPDGITKDDQEKISQHAAWRWFESFRHPKLSYLAMDIMANTIVTSLLKQNPQEDAVDNEPVMSLWSAHDSTLISLMCLFRLEQPAIWPEYGSYLMIELIDIPVENAWYVRFSLNGTTLKSMWDPEEPMEMIPLATLWEHVESQNPTSIDTSSIMNEMSFREIERMYELEYEEFLNKRD
jgi:Histidine phosphatase superfamily (branch 2)